MALIIRLSRSGRVHLPFYHIGVFDSRTRRDGRPVEDLGLYDPLSKKEQVRLNLEMGVTPEIIASASGSPQMTLRPLAPFTVSPSMVILRHTGIFWETSESGGVAFHAAASSGTWLLLPGFPTFR